MGYCRVSAVRALEKELLSGNYLDEKEAVNAAIENSLIRLDGKEKLELIHIANEQKRNDMILRYFV